MIMAGAKLRAVRRRRQCPVALAENFIAFHREAPFFADAGAACAGVDIFA
jgi:hypothetical protein